MLHHKKLSLLIAAGLAASMLAVPAFAQDGDAPAENAPAHQQKAKGERRSMFDRLETQLKLTDEQKATVHPIFADAEKQLNDIRKNKDLSEEEQKDQRGAVLDSVSEKVNPSLNDEQKAILAKSIERMKNPPQRGQRGDRGNRGNWGNRQKPAPAPQPDQDQDGDG